jgi:hypothetical protein
MFNSIPTSSLNILLDDAAGRDLQTARRRTLLQILLHERYLTREQLITRVEGVLQRGCFGEKAWEDTFYRDMKVVKKALKAAGYELCYRRSARQAGYYLQGEPAVSKELSDIIRGSVSEVDPRQIKIFHSMTPAERFQIGASASDAAREAVAYRIRQRKPWLSIAEAHIFAVSGNIRNE